MLNQLLTYHLPYQLNYVGLSTT